MMHATHARELKYRRLGDTWTCLQLMPKTPFFCSFLTVKNSNNGVLGMQEAINALPEAERPEVSCSASAVGRHMLLTNSLLFFL